MEHKTIRKDQQIKIHILNIKSKYSRNISLRTDIMKQVFFFDYDIRNSHCMQTILLDP